MKRFWISWWSGNYEDEGCTKPPFQFWVSGQRDRDNDDSESERDECAICAVIDANSEEEIWPVVKKHFPDYEPRFCTEKRPDYVPNDRFPDFRGETSLVPKFEAETEVVLEASKEERENAEEMHLETSVEKSYRPGDISYANYLVFSEKFALLHERVGEAQHLFNALMHRAGRISNFMNGNINDRANFTTNAELDLALKGIEEITRRLRADVYKPMGISRREG